MPFARTTDPQTSHDAAASVKNISETQNYILECLRLYPMTDVTLATWFESTDAPHASESGIRSRRADLVERGLVKDSGERVKLASGRHAIVWMAALMTLDEERDAVQAEADAQRVQHMREWLGITDAPIKRVYRITPEQGARRKRKKAAKPQSDIELMFFHAGRYSAGIRDEKAVAAHFAILKGKR